MYVDQPTNRGLNHRTVVGIERKIVMRGERNVLSRLFHATNDKDTIVGWKQDLNKILHIFNVRLVDLSSFAITESSHFRRSCY